MTAGMRVVVEPRDGKWLVKDAALCFGGMAPMTVAAPLTEVCLCCFSKGMPLLLLSLTVGFGVVLRVNCCSCPVMLIPGRCYRSLSWVAAVSPLMLLMASLVLVPFVRSLLRV